MQRPGPDEYKPYYDRYISQLDSQVGGDDILGLLERQIADIHALLDPLSAEQSQYRYAEGKWSVRGVVDHLIDLERIFGYRALCVSRGETQELPAFDENEFAAISDADRRDLPALVDELEGARRSNLTMMRRFDDAAWTRIGRASSGPISPRALAFIIAGHQEHHVKILKERYGLGG